ncbi:uncharacterized protein B0I36DRAFT_46831 [Microdochium trichocladiopsis]|uniref:Uncharacterized protein n=1 Tax=Microdochium trichocladiopsis TaxID=1682393 RepID=A0A9P8XTY3_9PEZI|nr:uncharacterized protein B0I36DRAFT_46831 [Microdochium trichocladiopsis]KAH7016488.1 hypothetical protein B0I36DRAFT_46831 [Microdochium trichocladiopsis]
MTPCPPCLINKARISSTLHKDITAGVDCFLRSRLPSWFVDVQELIPAATYGKLESNARAALQRHRDALWTVSADTRRQHMVGCILRDLQSSNALSEIYIMYEYRALVVLQPRARDELQQRFTTASAKSAEHLPYDPTELYTALKEEISLYVRSPEFAAGVKPWLDLWFEWDITQWEVFEAGFWVTGPEGVLVQVRDEPNTQVMVEGAMPSVQELRAVPSAIQARLSRSRIPF